MCGAMDTLFVRTLFAEVYYSRILSRFGGLLTQASCRDSFWPNSRPRHGR